MLELCTTRTKNSSPNIFNFYVILAGHDMITDAGRATICSPKFKAPWLETIVKKWSTFRKHGLKREKGLKILDEKRTKPKISTFRKHLVEHRAPEN